MPSIILSCKRVNLRQENNIFNSNEILRNSWRKSICLHCFASYQSSEDVDQKCWQKLKQKQWDHVPCVARREVDIRVPHELLVRHIFEQFSLVVGESFIPLQRILFRVRAVEDQKLVALLHRSFPNGSNRSVNHVIGWRNFCCSSCSDVHRS